jgi:hypothetical protein
MYCTQCGTENSRGATTCSRCAAALYEPGSTPTPPLQTTSIPSYLIPSILVTLCCCQIPGIVAIVYAAQVNGLIRAGEFAGARRASRLAWIWVWVAFGIGVLVGIGFVLVEIAALSVSEP